MNRLKQVREEIVAKQKRLDEIEATCTKEERGWTEAELEEVDQIEKDVDNLIKERSLLQKQSERKEQLAKEELERKGKEEKVEERGETKVTSDNLKTKEARNYHVEEIFRGIVRKDDEMVRKARKQLAEGGHYDDLLKENRDGFSTLKDGKGGIFLPTALSNEIFDMEQNYGAIPQFSQNFGISSGRLKIPSILSRPAFSAVNEKSAISGSGMSFGGMILDPLKWGAIVDWTNEVGAEAGARLLPILQRKMAEASAYLKDNVFINGDGTSTYNNIKGLIGLVGGQDYVRKTVAAAGNVGFSTIDADDWLSVQFDLSPSARSGGIYITHPDQEEHLRKLKDGQGMYIYGGPSQNSPIPTLWGKRLFFTEAFPVTDGTDKPVAAFYNPGFAAYGTGANFSVTQLTEATITDEDGNSVNLATQDAQALRFTELFDIELSQVTITTAGTARGAFALLYTNTA